jgi:formiminotetrahydrofolate cyclodeaminase
MTLSAVVSDLVAGLTDDTEPPAGGAVSAVTAALAASLVAKLARHSRSSWSEAGATAAQADALRARSVSLGAEGASAYRAALAVLDAGERGDEALAHALDRAAAVPLRIARTACDVALLAASVSEAGLPALGADAAVAAALAEGAARGAAHLVGVNLTAVPGDARIAEANGYVSAAGAAARRALQAGA